MMFYNGFSLQPDGTRHPFRCYQCRREFNYYIRPKRKMQHPLDIIFGYIDLKNKYGGNPAG